jgi:uncharacterized protein (TIGR02001 family)
MKMFLLLAPAAMIAAPAAAAVPLPGTNLSVNGEANLLSDYRFRGVSRSDGDPALQGQLTITHGSGFYLGTRATSLDGLDNFRFRDPQFQDLGDVELDVYAGYGRDLGAGVSVDGGLLYYAFAGGAGDTDYFEPYASASYLLGPVEATAGAKYAPAQRAIGDEDMLYLFGEAEASIPFTGFAVTGHLGHQDWGRFGSYWNWSLGARTSFGPVRAGIRYVDTGLPETPLAPGRPPLTGVDGGVVLSLGVGF